MAKAPAVSVIAPIYNVEQYVKFCVDSILAQTFQYFEIILVDDASSDNSYALCQKFYGGNDKVKFVRHDKNQGLGAARNTGIKHAAGKYVYFLDSDDYILPDALEKFYNVAEKSNAEVVHAAAWYELNQNEPAPIRKENLHLKADRYNREGFLSNDLIRRLDINWRLSNTMPMTWLYFCRRDFLAQKHIEFLNIISEDETFHFALLCLAQRYYVLSAPLYVYRKRSGSIMKTQNLDRFRKGIRALIEGSIYVGSILDLFPKSDGYEQWRESILNEFFQRFSTSHTAPNYNNLNISLAQNATAKKNIGACLRTKRTVYKIFL